MHLPNGKEVENENDDEDKGRMVRTGSTRDRSDRSNCAKVR
jgi:hypothetical protein